MVNQRFEAVMFGAWAFVLLWLIWLCSGVASPAEGATWRDVLNSYKASQVSDSATRKTWVEEYGCTGATCSYRVFNRDTSRGPGGYRSTEGRYYLPNAWTMPSACTVGWPPYTGGNANPPMVCDGSGATQAAVKGANYYGGGQAFWGPNDCSVGGGSLYQRVYSYSCLGAPTMTSNNSLSGMSQYASVQECAYTRSVLSGAPCEALDELVQDHQNVDPAGCIINTIQRAGFGVTKIGECNCVPRGYVPTGERNAVGACYFAQITGDPGVVGTGGNKGNGGTSTGGTPCVAGEPGCTAPADPGGGGGGEVPVVPPGGGGTGSSVPVSGLGPGGSVPVTGTGGGAVVVTGTGGGGSVTVGGTGAGGGVKTDINEEAKEDAGASVPAAPVYGPFTDADKPVEQDWGDLITDFIANNPVSTALRGMGTVTTENAACSFTSPIFGQDITFSMCGLESALLVLGTCILAIATLYSVWIIALGA